MGQDLISKKTRYEFREYFVGWTLRTIEAEFDAADVPCDAAFQPAISGQRRSLVEQYYHAVDWSDFKQVRRVLAVYENVLVALEESSRTASTPSFQEQAKRDLQNLTKWLARDGFDFTQGKLVPTHQMPHLPEIQGVAAGMDAPELHKQIERIRTSVDDDPRLAIGTAKELVETTCKTILMERGIASDSSWDIARLVKETRAALVLLPGDVPEAAKGAETIRRILSNLGTIAQGLGELRNLYGTGHGPAGKARGLSSRHARPAAGAAATLASFLLETHEERSSEKS